MSGENNNIIELTEKEVQEFQKTLKELKQYIRKLKKLPITLETITLYYKCNGIVQMYKEAIKSKKWDKSNEEFIAKTMQELKNLLFNL